MNTQWMTTLGAAVLLSLAGCSNEAPSDSAEEANAARVSQSGQNEASSPVSVTAAPIETRHLQAWVYSQGTARSRQREFLTFTQQGVVSYVDETLRVGSPVKEGQVIAHQAPERVQADLQAARAALAEAEASLALANVTRTRYENLIKQRSASKQELDMAVVEVEQAKAGRDNARAQLEQAQLGVNESRLVSPIDGVLARLNIEKGRYFMPSTVQTGSEQDALRTVPAMVINPNLFEIRADLPAYDFRRIKEGARVVIGSNPPIQGQYIDPDSRTEQVQGQVHAISPSLDPETRTFEVIVHTQDAQPGLQDGEFVAVWIAEASVGEALAVPLDALRFRNDQAFVFVVDEATRKVTERRVELGQQSGEFRAINGGVKEGERVVTDGRAALHDGQQVHILTNSETQQ